MKRLLPLLLALSPLLHASTPRLGTDVVPVAQSIRLDVDPRSDTFTGSVAVDLDVKKPASAIRFHAVDLTITSLKLTKGGKEIETTFAPDAGSITVVTPKTKMLLPPGRYALAIDYKDVFNRQAVGLYKMVAKGEPYLFSQFEAIDARRAFPCWDEPGFKLPYELTVTIPKQYDAVSNTPIAEVMENGDAKTIRFAKTKPLPSYLLALAVGQFDFTPIKGMRVPGRIVAPKGQGNLAGTAAEVTPAILAALEKYFGAKYPFEKIDLIAVPEYWAGAMENPGAITFRDTVLLVDPANATPTQRQSMIRITAHELSHMWFGDLVTMAWWDDFWLNESFADWMGDKITEQVHPEFEHLIGEMSGVQNVMGQDARPKTDPIQVVDSDPEDAMRRVGLAYNKGKSVLSMFEQWIGEEKFRQGVLAHLKDHAWGNATSSQFFASLSKAAPAGTAAAMKTFIAQPGIPLVSVEVKGNTATLTQKRFSTSDAKAETWSIPVTLRYSDGKTVRTAAVMLDKPSQTLELKGDSIAWLDPDAHAVGYYRWHLDDASMAKLAANASSALEPRERLAFVGNLGALFRAGLIHGDAYLNLLSSFASDTNPHVLDAVVTALNNVHATFDTDENRPRFAAYVRRTLGPALERIGFQPQAGEPLPITVLRPTLITWLAEYGEDAKVWTFVKEQGASVDPTIASVVARLNAERGDAALFDEYQKRFEAATLPAERARYLGALGSFSDPALRAKAREYALTPAVRPTELFALMGMGDTEAERDEFFTWVTANFDAIAKKLPPAFAGAMAAIANGCDPARVTKAREFFIAKGVPAERSLGRVSETVNECAALRTRELDAVTRYLSEGPR
jgi:alanyl aminopeptidase